MYDSCVIHIVRINSIYTHLLIDTLVKLIKFFLLELDIDTAERIYRLCQRSEIDSNIVCYVEIQVLVEHVYSSLCSAVCICMGSLLI